MQAPINTEALQEKWGPLLNAEGQDKITDLIVRWLQQFSWKTKKKH